ncbi:MAG: type II toxin-antitoxin system VapC family toxin [Thermomicrobiales bacterium]
MTRTYVDAGVLIAAATMRDPVLYGPALAVLDDTSREHVSSSFLWLEVVPKATYHRRPGEVAFYEAFFVGVSAWVDSYDEVLERAFTEASQSGLAALDALHVAAAIQLGAEELITTERLQKPIHRVTEIKIVSIHPSASHVS